MAEALPLLHDPVFLLLLLGEGVSRLLGYPKGRFASVYPPNATLTMTWGAVPYTVQTNSLGLRGREVSVARVPGRKRILARGDSITAVADSLAWAHLL